MFQIIIGISSFELVDVSCSVTERSDASKKEAAPKRTKTKLSFNEQREYDNIENDIMICEEKIDGLDREIAASFLEASDLSVTDGVFFREAVIFALPAHSVSHTDFAEFANEPCSR